MVQLRKALPGAATVGLVLASACGDDIAFKDRAPFNAPADAVAGFLGYFSVADKQTTCGNCHADEQATWSQTHHADAWSTLQNSGAAQDFCEPCHTVSQNGNAVTAVAGYPAVRDDAALAAVYHDVQCESCHGPGFQHVSVDPGASQPIAGADLGANIDQNCAECHSGDHHPFAEDWAASGHAAVVGFAAGRESCEGCHRGQAALARFDPDATYLEQNSATHMPTTCSVCHDPHGSNNTAQLRRPIETSDPTQHLCAQCHDRRTAPDPNSSHGLEPHSPETALILGDAGWFPPNAIINQGDIIGTHGTESNAQLCATCHVTSFAVTDAVTGDFQFNATGHLFAAIPCIDANGGPLRPQPDDCELTTTARTFRGCTAAGCHGTEAVARGLLLLASGNNQTLADDLLAQLTVVDPNLEDAGGEIDATNPTFTVAEGAIFNYHLALHGGSPLGSSTHNPFLVEALLIASQQAVEDTYGVAPSTPIDYDARLQALTRRFNR